MQPALADLLSLAHAVAKVKHTGQTRKGPAAEPYYNHPRRVGLRANRYALDVGLGGAAGVRAEIVGLLHDLVEDTSLEPLDLRRIGFDWTTVDDVVGLSRRKNETYFEFIERGTKDLTDEGLLVKLADLADNLSDGWGGASLRARYIQADLMVRAELHRRGIAVNKLAPSSSPS